MYIKIKLFTLDEIVFLAKVVEVVLAAVIESIWSIRDDNRF